MRLDTYAFSHQTTNYKLQTTDCVASHIRISIMRINRVTKTAAPAVSRGASPTSRSPFPIPRGIKLGASAAAMASAARAAAGEPASPLASCLAALAAARRIAVKIALWSAAAAPGRL